MARGWFAVCAALALAGVVAWWSGVWPFTLTTTEDALAVVLRDHGVPDAADVVTAMLLIGRGVEVAVFAWCAARLVRRAGEATLPYVLAAGLLAGAVTFGLPSRGVAEAWRWVFDVDSIIAVSTVAFAVLTVPEGRFATGLRKAFWLGWTVTIWLSLYPVGLPWTRFDESDWIWSLHLGFLSVGLAFLIVRYVELTAARRMQVQWVLSGMTALVVGTLVKLLLGPGTAGTLFTLLVYPLIMCLAPLAATIAVLEIDLWRLRGLQRTMFIVATVGACSLLFGLGLDRVWHRFGLPPGWFVLVWAGTSALAPWLSRRYVSRLVDRLVFPDLSDREKAHRLGCSALEDTLKEREVLWAVNGIFALGWPRSRVEVYRRTPGGVLVALKDSELMVDGSGTLGPSEAPTPPPAPAVFRTIPDTAKSAAAQTLWIYLRSHQSDAGVVRVVPLEGFRFSADDLRELEHIVPALADAVWRVNQRNSFTAAALGGSLPPPA